MTSSISTSRRLEYAAGYLSLGLVAEAETELDEIVASEQTSLPVLALRADLHTQAKRWKQAVDCARQLVSEQPEDPHGWIILGVAIRRLESVAAAEQVLLTALPHIGERDATVHYNLACYRCLQGRLDEARASLDTACKMDANFRAAALEDPDLEVLWPELRAERG